jgi:hypothetical protein
LSRSALAWLDLRRLFSTMTKISYAGYRFPPEIIQQAIWLYVRFTLSFRDVEDLSAERGIMVSYETVRRWVNHFGPKIAASARTRTLSASIASRSNDGRGMPVTPPCGPTCPCVSARHCSPRCGRHALRRSSRRQASGRAFCAPPPSKTRGRSGAANRLPA